MILGFYDEEKNNPVLITMLSIGYIVGRRYYISIIQASIQFALLAIGS